MSDSTKSEFTRCSSSFASALVIGPILISLELSCAISSLIKNDGKEESFRVSKLFVNEGIKRIEKDVAYFGAGFLYYTM